MAYDHDERDHDQDEEHTEFDRDDEGAHGEHRLQRRERRWQREFEREREWQFGQFIRPWNEAGDNEAERIVMGWARGDPDEYGLVLTVLEQRCFRLAVELLEDEATALEVFDRTIQELRVLFTSKAPLYQGKNQFVAIFRRRLEWRCLDVLAGKYPRLSRKGPPPLPGKATWAEILGRLFEEDEQDSIEDTIAGETPTPEQAAEMMETEQEDAEKLRGFRQDLSAVRRQTLDVVLRIYGEAPGTVTKAEVFRRTKEILRISDNTLYGRMHQIKLTFRSWFVDPPPDKKGSKNRKRRKGD